MNRLIQISKEYEILTRDASKEKNYYFEQQNGQYLVGEEPLPKWKQLEFEYENKETEFIKTAKQFGRENALDDNELLITIANEISNTPNSINYFLLLKLMWTISKGQGSFCLKTLERIIRNILESPKIGRKEEYYLESFIDIWNYDTDELIPIDILQQIILLDSEELRNSYGAMIKAVSYLSGYPKAEVENILVKARETTRYKEDEYYKDWID